ncbi:MAG TPA: aspartate/glutamate racemase family protein [Bacteroidota bacterium]|nr:aspartate/glutamate racemase family protein [Bacteroidota bacterium]
MKTIGLIGGTSWVSTVEYYRIINRLTHERLGGANSAKILLYSVNFEEFKPPANDEGWKQKAEFLTGIAQRLERAGADCLLLCANTPHMVADDVQKRIGIPLLHIAEMTANEIRKQGIDTVALLGTKFTMEKDFFRNKLASHGIHTLIPTDPEREFIHQSIYTEFAKEVFTNETKKRYLHIIKDLESKGAKGIILGCTEIPLLIQQKDCDVPTFDTTLIHATSAVDFALSD